MGGKGRRKEGKEGIKKGKKRREKLKNSKQEEVKTNFYKTTAGTVPLRKIAGKIIYT